MSSSDEECRLLIGIPAFIAQLLVVVLAFSSLLWKRSRENPQRPQAIWFLDVGKQAVSMGSAHVCGLIIAMVAQRAAGRSSECAWYFVAYTFDTTFGLLLTISSHNAVIKGARCYLRCLHDEGLPAKSVEAHSLSARYFTAIAMCGNYGDPPSMGIWISQTLEWTTCVVLARGLCGYLVVSPLNSLLVTAANKLDTLFQGHATLLLMAVMILGPLLMNASQLLLQDTVLKWKKGKGSSVMTCVHDGQSFTRLLGERQ